MEAICFICSSESKLGIKLAFLVVQHDHDHIEERVIPVLHRIKQLMVEILRKLQTDLCAAVDAIRVKIGIVIPAQVVNAIDRADVILLIQHYDATADILQRRSVNHAHLIVRTLASFDHKRELLFRKHIPRNQGCYYKKE